MNRQGHGNSEFSLPSEDRQPPIAAKKTALRELQNQNQIVPPIPSVTKLHPFKDKVDTVDTAKLSGSKRPSTELSDNPSCNHSPASNSSNNHLVYVRRKSDNTIISLHCSESMSVNGLDEPVKQSSQVVGSKASCYTAVAPLPITSPPIVSLPKPSVPLPLGMPVLKLETLDSDPTASSSLLMENARGRKNLQWEERFIKLQQLLRNLDQADHTDYLKSIHLHLLLFLLP